ncbi:MAG TPA: hypothetical protein VD966_10805, partial [Pyrinomonadaceae bacterium]|nr:hypothetical protein [Pyrinomonadaceae bacterium]
MRTSPCWRLGAFASLAVMFLALYPQLDLWRELGGGWNGSYAYIDTDEVAYAAYLNALIDGRPRRNDPYTGLDDRPGAPQPESLFSIQFAPAYAIAAAARLLGLSVSTVFILLMPLAALATSLAIFWLIRMITGDDRLAATAVLFILCLGTLATGQGAVRYLLTGGTAYIYLPFLRRYIPAVAFPFYVLLCAFVWRMLTRRDERSGVQAAIMAGLTFALLVYSYYYLWTAAAAWLFCLALLWLIVRPSGWQTDIRLLGITTIIAVAALLPYSVLLSNRAVTMDMVQALTHTRAPDLLRVPELIGFAVLAGLALGARHGLISWRDRAALFAASLALTPVIVFNQHVLTGRSLQPIHYEQFIVNYLSLVSLVLAAALIWRRR